MVAIKLDRSWSIFGYLHRLYIENYTKDSLIEFQKIRQKLTESLEDFYNQYILQDEEVLKKYNSIQETTHVVVYDNGVKLSSFHLSKKIKSVRTRFDLSIHELDIKELCLQYIVVENEYQKQYRNASKRFNSVYDNINTLDQLFEKLPILKEKKEEIEEYFKKLFPDGTFVYKSCINEDVVKRIMED